MDCSFNSVCTFSLVVYHGEAGVTLAAGIEDSVLMLIVISFVI